MAFCAISLHEYSIIIYIKLSQLILSKVISLNYFDWGIYNGENDYWGSLSNLCIVGSHP